ncbi:Mob1/phocein [Mycena galericulata]|nr:Mob1/phocein [Mycena galericulata]
MAHVQRPLRGSRISTFYPVKNLPSLSSLDSAFQLQEYISLLIRLDVHDVDAIVSIPGRGKQKEKEKESDSSDDGKKTEVTVDEACWKYEQLRRLAQDLSHPLITMLQQVCTRTTCPEMKAGEWLYLCVAHGNDGAMEQCCAIDYILHTLDSATALLNSPRAFPSRLQIPPTSHRHFSSLARRLGRIFAHAYFHHREEFEQAEAESSLYARFLALTEKFDLVPADFLVIPPRVPAPAAQGDRRGSIGPLADVPPPTLLGAALHVDTASSAPAGAELETGAGREKSASPPGLDEALNTRRYGRSRTDTMMLEGDKFPPSPASAVEDSREEPTGLEAALAAASAEKRLAEAGLTGATPAPGCASVPAVSETPVPAVKLPHAPAAVSAPEPQAEVEATEAEGAAPSFNPEPEREPPSPPSDDELEPHQGTAMAIVSPSSSTAPQESAIMLDVEQERVREETPGPELVPVPIISVEPATPPPVEDASPDGEDKEIGLGDAPVLDEAKAKESAVEAKAEEVVPPSEPAVEAAPVVAEPEAKEESAAATPAPVPAVESVPAPVADEEVDVTDTEKDGEEHAKPELATSGEVSEAQAAENAENAGSDVSQS